MSISLNKYNNSHFVLMQDYFPAVAKLAQIKILQLYKSTGIYKLSGVCADIPKTSSLNMKETQAIEKVNRSLAENNVFENHHPKSVIFMQQLSVTIHFRQTHQTARSLLTS